MSRKRRGQAPILTVNGVYHLSLLNTIGTAYIRLNSWSSDDERAGFLDQPSAPQIQTFVLRELQVLHLVNVRADPEDGEPLFEINHAGRRKLREFDGVVPLSYAEWPLGEKPAATLLTPEVTK